MIKEALFDLIKSMTMSEKRYFKIYSSKHTIGEKNEYIRLFDAISAQEKYNEDKLKDFGFVKNLAVEKNYLYRIILKSLNSFHDQSSAKNKVYGILKSVEVLFHKGLYEQAMRQVSKARRIARDNELFAQELVVNELEVELLSKQFDYQAASNRIQEAEKVSEKLTNFNRLQKVTTDCYAARLEIGTSRSQNDSIRLQSFLQMDGVGDKGYPLTKRAEMYRLGLHLTYAYFIGDELKTLELTEQMTELYEGTPFLIEYSPIGYVSSLYNLHNAYKSCGKELDADRVLIRLEQCKTKYGIPTSDNIGARVFFYSTNIRLTNYLREYNVESAGALIMNTTKEFKRFSSKIGKPQLYEYYFLTAKWAFLSSDFRYALRQTNEILNDLGFKVRADLLSATRLLNLLIHYELRNDFTIEYLAKNTLSYLRKKDRLFKVEDELIRFILNHQKVQNIQDKVADLKQLSNELNKYKDHQFEGRPFDYFDFHSWAENKAKSELEGTQKKEK